MSFAVVQAGTSLQAVDVATGAIADITLPAGVTIDATLRCRFVVIDRKIVVFNAVSENIWIDPITLATHRLGIGAPPSAPTLAAGGGTGLTGAYRAKVAFGQKDGGGAVVNLSPLSEASNEVTLANEDLAVSAIAISSNPDVNFRRLYRTAAGGTTFFEWVDIDDNVTTSYVGSESDAAISDLPAPTITNAPGGTVPGSRMTLATAWKSRIWGVSSDDDEIDDAAYTDLNTIYAWSNANRLPAFPKGEDRFGITGFIPRRDALGLCKRSRLLKVIGESNDDFQVLIVVENIGVLASDSIVVIRDKAYFLWEDGVYRWDDEGVVCISRASVDPWFTTGTYFNRDLFARAVGGYNPFTNAYELGLVPAGETDLLHWVAYNIENSEWLGPNLTDAFTPSYRGLLKDDGALLPAIGSDDGYLYLQNQAVLSDVAAAAVAIHGKLRTRHHSQKNPDITHYWGRLALESRVESGGTLTARAYVGGVDAAAGVTQSFNLTLGRQIGLRLGVGRLCSLEFEQQEAGLGFLIYGYSITETFEVGRR